MLILAAAAKIYLRTIMHLVAKETLPFLEYVHMRSEMKTGRNEKTSLNRFS